VRPTRVRARCEIEPRSSDVSDRASVAGAISFLLARHARASRLRTPTLQSSVRLSRRALFAFTPAVAACASSRRAREPPPIDPLSQPAASSQPSLTASSRHRPTCLRRWRRLVFLARANRSPSDPPSPNPRLSRRTMQSLVGLAYPVHVPAPSET
jgi:hypothetical protein